MTDFEKELVSELDKDYLSLATNNSEILALHTANLTLHYGIDEKKVFDDIIQIIAISAQKLRVAPGKVVAKTGMPVGKVVQIEPGYNTFEVNVDYVAGKEDLESARKLLIGIHAAVFLRYVKAVVESEDSVVKAYADKMGWSREWKQPVDRRENPRLYFQQKYLRTAIAYGIVVSEESLKMAGIAMRKLQESRGKE